MQRREVTESVKKKKINKFALITTRGRNATGSPISPVSPTNGGQAENCGDSITVVRSRHIDTFLLKSVQSFARSTKTNLSLFHLIWTSLDLEDL